MSRLGYFCDFVTGRLNPILAIASQLKKRGHENIFFTIADSEATVRGAGHDFRQIGYQEFPLGSKQRFYEEISRWSGAAAGKNLIRHYQRQSIMTMNDGFEMVRESKVDGLIIDQNQFAGGTVAERLGLPFIHIVPGVPPNENPFAPSFVSSRNYKSTLLNRCQNRFEYFMLRKFLSPVLLPINQQRNQWHLPQLARYDETFSKRLQICQMPVAFEFPQKIELPYFKYSGPFTDSSSRKQVEFPWDQLDGRPLIYASLGTVMTMFPKAAEMFTTIVKACSGLDAQLVLSLGGSLQQLSPEAKALGEKIHAIIVPYAPQLELISRSTAVITHAGLNSTLETLAQGVPAVAIPIAFDQAGVGARLHFRGAGIVLTNKNLTASALQSAICTILTDHRYRLAAEALRDEIIRVDGLKHAADKIEFALSYQE